MESIVGLEMLVWTGLSLVLFCLMDGAAFDVFGFVTECVVVGMHCSLGVVLGMDLPHDLHGVNLYRLARIVEQICFRMWRVHFAILFRITARIAFPGILRIRSHSLFSTSSTCLFRGNTN